MDKEQIKKRQQIYNLKTLLFTENTKSKKLKSKISELQSIFKLVKKIIKEKINQIESSKSDKNKNEIKKQICIEIKNIIDIYKTKNRTLINNQDKEKKIVREKVNQLKILLRDSQYYELKDKKDLIVQIIQEKKDLYGQIIINLKAQKDIFFLFQQKYYYHFNNLYEVKMINFYGDKKYDEEILKLKNKYNHRKKYLKKAGEKALIKLNDELENEKILFDKFIDEKGFRFQFHNNHFKENYDIEIESINKYINSSDSSTDSEENNENENSSKIKNDFLNMEDNKIITEKRNSKDKKTISSGQKQKKKNSYPSSDNKNSKNNKESKKGKHSQTVETEKNKDNINNNLVNKLVEIKEKYNKLINERYELDYRKKKLEKKLQKIKTKISNIKKHKEIKK